MRGITHPATKLWHMTEGDGLVGTVVEPDNFTQVAGLMQGMVIRKLINDFELKISGYDVIMCPYGINNGRESVLKGIDFSPLQAACKRCKVLHLIYTLHCQKYFFLCLHTHTNSSDIPFLIRSVYCVSPPFAAVTVSTLLDLLKHWAPFTGTEWKTPAHHNPPSTKLYSWLNAGR